MAIILGIDPGSRITGYGLISSVGSKLEYIDAGCIRTETASLPDRLKIIFAGVSEIIEKYSPQESAIEEVFMGRNAGSALKLGQARGCAMTACLAKDLPVEEYSARKVKQALVGNGAADKLQVQHMVKILLGIDAKNGRELKLQEDAGDALAIAICHANSQANLIKMATARSFSRKRFK